MATVRDCKNLCILLENSTEGLGSRRKHCWGYIPAYENTPKKLLHLPPKSCHNFYLMVQGKVQLEHSSHIVKVGAGAAC